MVSETPQYKHDIIQRLGGQSMFEFIVLSLVEQMKKDTTLKTIFTKFSTEDLVAHETQFLKTVFTKHPSDHDVKGSILLRNYDLIKRGFNETHFDLLIKYFVQAMEDSWVDEAAVGDAVSMLKSSRYLFEKREKTASTVTSPKKPLSLKNIIKQEKAAAERRSSSGEFLLNKLRARGAKRSKQSAQ